MPYFRIKFENNKLCKNKNNNSSWDSKQVLKFCKFFSSVGYEAKKVSVMADN